jgi:hypothetical protein
MKNCNLRPTRVLEQWVQCLSNVCKYGKNMPRYLLYLETYKPTEYLQDTNKYPVTITMIAMKATFVKHCDSNRENTVLHFVLRQYGKALSNISPSSVPTENLKANMFLLKDSKDKQRNTRNNKIKGMKRNKIRQI